MYKIQFNFGLSESLPDNLLDGYKMGRYGEDKSLDDIQSALLLHHTLIDYIKKSGKYILAKDITGIVKGILLFRKSEWDTDHFGYNVGVIDYLITVQEKDFVKTEIASTLLNSFDNWSKEQQIKFVSTKIPSLDLAVLHAVEKYGFGYIENWIYNHYDIRHLKKEEKSLLKIRFGVPSDEEFMIKYSKGAFATQRFHADLKIDANKADLLYEKWIRTAFLDPNQEIAVYDYEGVPTAFMIYYKHDLSNYFNLKFAMWKMGFVNPALGQRGIGYEFVRSLFQFHADQNLDIIDSGLSIRNIPSVNWHNKLNFKITSTLVTFHKWYS